MYPIPGHSAAVPALIWREVGTHGQLTSLLQTHSYTSSLFRVTSSSNMLVSGPCEDAERADTGRMCRLHAESSRAVCEVKPGTVSLWSNSASNCTTMLGSQLNIFKLFFKSQLDYLFKYRLVLSCSVPLAYLSLCFCSMVTMVIQFSVLIILHSCLVLVTTAEDYKCLPLVLRKACCWINETYAARNVIIFVSILINFLAAMINIVSSLVIFLDILFKTWGQCLSAK